MFRVPNAVEPVKFRWGSLRSFVPFVAPIFRFGPKSLFFGSSEKSYCKGSFLRRIQGLLVPANPTMPFLTPSQVPQKPPNYPHPYLRFCAS